MFYIAEYDNMITSAALAVPTTAASATAALSNPLKTFIAGSSLLYCLSNKAGLVVGKRTMPCGTGKPAAYCNCRCRALSL